jgi:hypothetical protein
MRQHHKEQRIARSSQNFGGLTGSMDHSCETTSIVRIARSVGKTEIRPQQRSKPYKHRNKRNGHIQQAPVFSEFHQADLLRTLAEQSATTASLKKPLLKFQKGSQIESWIKV